MRRAEDQRRSELLDAVLDCARSRLSDTDAKAFLDFLPEYYASVPLEDLDSRPADALFGAALAHWRLGEVRPTATPLVHVYNPRPEEDGWRSEHTVVEIVTDDMPFLVDSVTAALNRREPAVLLVVHPILKVRRDTGGRLLGMLRPTDSPEDAWRESFMHIEITRQPEEALPGIADTVQAVLADVRVAVGDWAPMRARLDAVITEIEPAAFAGPADDVEDGREFLQWLRENNFTFLGYRQCAVVSATGGPVVQAVDDAGLGLLRDPAVRLFEDLEVGAPPPPQLANLLASGLPVNVTKAHRASTVNRPVLMDVVLVAHPGVAEQPSRVHLFCGLFSAATYNRSARNIPLLRRKLSRVIQRAGFEPRSHDGRALANIVETFPRDELFQIDDDQFLEVALGILDLQQRQRVALFIRRDESQRFASCLVFVPRDRYTTPLRLAIHRILERALDGRVTAQYVQVGDAPLARLHTIVSTTPGRIPDFDVGELEREIVASMRTWADRLHEALQTAHGEEKALLLSRRYSSAFPPGYQDRFSPDQAIDDIALIEQALAEARLGMALYRPFGATHMQFRFKVYHPDQPVVLSHVLPILEHLGLRVVDEVPHAVRVRTNGQRTVMIHDFGLETQSGVGIDMSRVADRFQDAFRAVWEGHVESDRLNALVLSAGLAVREVTILRAYGKYLRQAGIPFTQAYLERVLNAHPAITGAVVRLFLALFDPDAAGDPDERAAPLRAAIAEGLENVASAEDDRILRRFLNLVESTLRTNYFQHDAEGRPKPGLAFKLDSSRIEDLPLPRPMIEVFVYAPRFEAIHLRGGKVARGGIRWSDRREDFRTEILGLMKAQMVKNAVIVPVGAKGGFVVKQTLDPADREAWLAAGIACYRSFIASLLDVTDNRVGDRIVPPPRVVRRDSDDPYLVVAADKGTATFSDIANGIAADYGFWLGDAFASGGSQGYDHKAMGITARGAWESVKRHFREMGHDTQSLDFTVIGVGDMSGDVFGNGMLLSPHIRLLAAFDHRHIFVDPDPDPATSFAERQRLFALPRSSWQDYDAARLSNGGAIFERSAKMLTLSPEICARFELEVSRLTPTELIRALLRASVDLLWFGGIGTFVKSADETHAEVGDRANDPVRADGGELRCKVIGEGANLGITQLGRIEFARNGGRLNTDFIDNSAGVDCSDHEVNIKILVDAEVAAGELTTKHRNQLLVSMTDEVADLVLRDNYLQTQALSLMQADGFNGLDGQARLMRLLERQGRLNRAVEFLPDDEALTERAARRQGLTRPELAVLFSYGKIWLNDAVLASDLPDDSHVGSDVSRYFPQAIRERFVEGITRHRLRRELIATTITNSLINRMGGTFVADLSETTGLSPADVARGYIIARDVFAVREVWDGIEALDGSIPTPTQVELHGEVQQLLERTSLWFLRNGGRPVGIADNIGLFGGPVQSLAEGIELLLPEAGRRLIALRAERWVKEGVPEALARLVARLVVMPSACDIVRIATDRSIGPETVARVYFFVGGELGFGWLRERAQSLSTAGHWQRLAVSAIIEELYAHQRDVTQEVLPPDGTTAEASFESWRAPRQAAVDRNRALLTELEAAKEIDISMLTVASRQLRALAGS